MHHLFAVRLPFLAPDDLAPPAATGAAAPRAIVCDFCQCALAADGGVLKRSDRARALLDLEDAMTKASRLADEQRARIAELTEAVTAAQAKLDALPAAPAARRGWLDPD